MEGLTMRRRIILKRGLQVPFKTLFTNDHAVHIQYGSLKVTRALKLIIDTFICIYFFQLQHVCQKGCPNVLRCVCLIFACL
jgi:hypothetical protein